MTNILAHQNMPNAKLTCGIDHRSDKQVRGRPRRRRQSAPREKTKRTPPLNVSSARTRGDEGAGQNTSQLLTNG